MSNTQTLGPKALRKARDALGETQGQFAVRLGINQATLSRWERDGLPKGGTAAFLVQRVLDDLARVYPLTVRR
jgi:DNA-binding transcriptional regulator YiaG